MMSGEDATSLLGTSVSSGGESAVSRIAAALKNHQGCLHDQTHILEKFIREKLFHHFVYLYKDKNKLHIIKQKLLTKVLENLTVNNVHSKNEDMQNLGQEEWELYLTTLFNRSWEDSRIHNVFNLRRSGMYGAMKTKFEGKVKT